jgi:DNA-binding response OmpR family regulator
MKGYEVGGSLYLTKPFDPARLLRNVEVSLQTNPIPVAHKRYTIQQLAELERAGAAKLAQAQAERSSLRIQPESAPSPSPAPALAQRPEPADRGPVREIPPKARILVVDDDPEIHEVAAAALSSRFELLFASDGIQAIERIATYQPDIVIMDAMTPKMSGYQICQSLRRNVRYSKTPILFISAKASLKDQEYARRIGVNAFLAKPFNQDAFAWEVNQLTTAPGFSIHPKALTMDEILLLEQKRERELKQRQAETSAIRQQMELESFLKQQR